MNEASQSKILLVDDAPNILKALKRTFKAEGYTILTAESANEAMQMLNDDPDIDLIIADENMPEISGTELLSAARALFPDIVRIMLTGTSEVEVLKNAVNRGAIYRFFSKPWDEFELLVSVRHALKEKHAREKYSELENIVKKQSELLQELEKKHPGITKMKTSSDGAIILNE